MTHPSHLRSLYRQLLRELPLRQPSSIANPSPLHARLRAAFSSTEPPPTPAAAAARVQSAEEYAAYLQAQRGYVTLVERYNPGMNMTDEDRVRLTARRVGMDLPEELRKAFNRGGGRGEGGER